VRLASLHRTVKPAGTGAELASRNANPVRERSVRDAGVPFAQHLRDLSKVLRGH